MSGEYKAVVCSKLYDKVEDAIEALQLKSVPRKRLGKKDVRIQVVCSALNFYDLLMLVGKYQFKPKLPFVVGNEGSGIVTEIGDEVSNVKVGDEVIFMFGLGAFAEEITVHSSQCVLKPKSMSFVDAGAVFVGFATAYHGLKQRGNLQKGEVLLVTGAGGGMGAAAVQVGKALGATVIAAASSEEKLKVAKEMGADYLINYSKEDLKAKVSEITKGNLADVVYDPVGGFIFELCTRCVGDGGRLLVIGFTSGNIPKIPANIPLIKGFSVVGVRCGESFRRKPQLAVETCKAMDEFSKQGKLKPHVELFQASAFKEAFRRVAQREVTGKAVILWKQPSKL